MSASRRHALAALALALALAGSARAADLHGQVDVGLTGAARERVGPVVVYLEAASGSLAFPTPRRDLRIRQSQARFSPEFLAIAVGETVVMPNDDVIFHNVFSYSTPNDFDLGLYPRGESREKAFLYPGVVRIYCSIHESMSATIFVAPSIWYDVAKSDGSYALRHVPPGRYRLRTWSRRLPSTAQAVEVRGDRTLRVDLALGAVPAAAD